MNKNSTATGQGEDLLLGDAAKLKAFRAGQADVLTEIFLHYAPTLRSVLYACGLRTAADIDDALQSVFLRAFVPKARQDYSGLSPYGAYLKRIARNIVYDLHKSGRTRFETLQPDLAEQQSSDQDWAKPDARYDQAESEALRAQFLQRLEPPEPKVYALCFGKGLGEREAAAQLGFSRYQLRKYLDSIRARLTAFIKEQGLYD